MNLREQIWDNSTRLDAIADYLDGLTPAARLAETRTLERKDQRRLFEQAGAAEPLALEDFIGPEVGPRVEVIHNGRNTLPLPAPLRLFQKRLCRPESGEGRLFGYNQSPFVSTIGPGFFVLAPTAGNKNWEVRGGVVGDYYRMTDGSVAPWWPEVIPNSKGLQFFVYNHTRDFMRRVSKHVTVGAAYKGEKSLDHYFMLCRE